jgi:hypothetical protein
MNGSQGIWPYFRNHGETKNMPWNSFESTPWNDVPFVWHEILTEITRKDKRVLVQKRMDGEAPRFIQAAMDYCKEKVEPREGIDGEHLDFEPDEGPWF